MTQKNKPELLAPAGDLERLRGALDYGADAVYLGRESFSMRAAASNFHSAEQLHEAVALAHQYGKKVYLTCNTLPRNEEIPTFPQFLREAQEAGADALILADLGLLATARKLAPDMEIHMSTQTGIVNYATCQALYDMGVKRAVLARELSLEEIAGIRAKIPAEMELEVFVHGANCACPFRDAVCCPPISPDGMPTAVPVHSPAAGTITWWNPSGRDSISL